MAPLLAGPSIFVALRADPQTEHLPVIILTSQHDAPQWHEELRAADRFLAKPWDNQELLASVRALLERT